MREKAKYDDYTGFSFNGIHCSQFGLIRVSNGTRYEGGILPSFENITQQGSREGQFYYGKKNRGRSFYISTAFDSVTEQELSEIKQWLSTEIGELIFDERPYIKYYCTLADVPTFNYIAFNQYDWNDKGEKYISGRIYKGELTFTLTSNEPYGYCVALDLEDKIYKNYGNIREWYKASGLATQIVKDDNGKGQFTKNELGDTNGQYKNPTPYIDTSNNNCCSIWNPGDVEAPILFLIQISQGLNVDDTLNIWTSEDSRWINKKLQIQLKGIKAASTEVISIDTESRTIFVNGKLSNDKIIVDNFFNIPVKNLGNPGKMFYIWITISSTTTKSLHSASKVIFTPRYL